MFKNLTMFRFPASFAGLFPSAVADALDSLDAHMAQHQLRPVGALEVQTRGFVSPFGQDAEGLVHRVGDAAWVTLGGEDKILPPAVINRELSKRIRAVEQREGRAPGGRARKRMKEDLVHDLLPRAFVKPGKCDAYFDFDSSVLFVDTASRKVAEQVVSHIRHAVGSFPALPLNAEVAPRAVLTGWLAGEALPAGLTLGEECELRSASTDGARVKVERLDLAGDEIAQHLEAGMQCTRLALIYQDRLSFVFGEDLVVRKLKFLDGALDSLDSQEREDLRAELDARFALQAGEVSKLFEVLEAAFKLSRADDEEVAAQAPKRAPRARRGRKLEGIESITISGPGFDSVTLSPEEFRTLPEKARQLGEVIAWVRANNKTTISAMQRHLACGYNAAARVIESLEKVGVLSPPDPEGHRTVLPPGAIE